jgi:hypothetical protein
VAEKKGREEMIVEGQRLAERSDKKEEERKERTAED